MDILRKHKHLKKQLRICSIRESIVTIATYCKQNKKLAHVRSTSSSSSSQSSTLSCHSRHWCAFTEQTLWSGMRVCLPDCLPAESKTIKATSIKNTQFFIVFIEIWMKNIHFYSDTSFYHPFHSFQSFISHLLCGWAVLLVLFCFLAFHCTAFIALRNRFFDVPLPKVSRLLRLKLIFFPKVVGLWENLLNTRTHRIESFCSTYMHTSTAWLVVPFPPLT